MPARRWRVGPDQAVWTEAYGEVPVVSREKIVEAIMDGEAMLHRTGGVLTIMVGRQPTDFPGEAVTTGCVVEWKDRAVAREEQERAVDVLPQAPDPSEWTPFDGTPEPSEDDEPVKLDLEQDDAKAEALEEARMAGVAASKPAVIEDEHGEPEEDISSIPPEKR